MLHFVRRNSVAGIAVAIAALVTVYGAASAAPGGFGRGASASKAERLPKNSVGAKQLKKNAVNSAKVKNNSLTGADIDVSRLGTVPQATHAASADYAQNASHAGNSDQLGGLAAAAFALAGASAPPSGPAGGALAGPFPSPSLDVSGGPCPNGRALTDISPQAILTCKPGVYSDDEHNVVVSPNPFNSGPAGAGACCNSGLGVNALREISSGIRNSALGTNALVQDSTGSDNSAVGVDALGENTTGNDNAAVGLAALGKNTVGFDNAAVGVGALGENLTGNSNSALGVNALRESTTGSGNAAVGIAALLHSTGSNNVALGYQAGFNLTSGGSNVDIANAGIAAESNTIRIGTQGTQTSTFLAGVSGATTAGVAAPVLVDANGQLGTTSSSRRFKRDIHPLGPQLDKLMKLRPVSFRYRRSVVHGSSPVEYGLIAEQVAKVYPNLVVYGKNGRPSAVAYQELPALLLAQAQRQQVQIARQRRQIGTLRGRLRGIGRLRAKVSWLMRHVRPH